MYLTEEKCQPVILLTELSRFTEAKCYQTTVFLLWVWTRKEEMTKCELVGVLEGWECVRLDCVTSLHSVSWNETTKKIQKKIWNGGFIVCLYDFEVALLNKLRYFAWRQWFTFSLRRGSSSGCKSSRNKMKWRGSFGAERNEVTKQFEKIHKSFSIYISLIQER